MSFLRRIFSWKTVRVLIFIFVALVTLAALVVAFENWRGKRAWLKFKTEWEAKGERFDLASFIPKPVPASENFGATPFFATLFDYHYTNGDPPVPVWHDSNALARAGSTTLSGRNDEGAESFGSRDKGKLTDLKVWQGYYRSNKNFTLPEQPESPGADILHALSKHDPVFAELRAAAERPHAHFPIHYEETFSSQLPHLAVLKGLSNIQRLRTLALLAENKPDEALAELRLCLRFSDSLKTEPLLISHLVRLALLQIGADTVWEGISTGRWNDQHLVGIQAALSRIYLFPELQQAMRGERACCNALLDDLRAGRLPGGLDTSFPRYLPSGFIYHNQLFLNRLHQSYSFDALDVEKRRVYMERADPDEPPEFRGKNPYKIMAGLMFPATSKASIRAARTQTTLDMAALACALERYRLARGKYPTTLQDLKPEFVRELPHDVITGEPLRYSLSENGGFLLYSVAVNQKDDHGVPAPQRGGPAQAARGDWVWTPAPRPN